MTITGFPHSYPYIFPYPKITKGKEKNKGQLNRIVLLVNLFFFSNKMYQVNTPKERGNEEGRPNPAERNERFR